MATAFYRARFEKQNTGSTLGWKNCAAASGAMLSDQATLGLKDPTPDQFRRMTGDFEGGLAIHQVGNVLDALGVNATIYNGSDGYTWDKMLADLKVGKFMVVNGNYSVLPANLRGDKDFEGNHSVFYHRVTATTVTVGDPLNDGRRPGIPNGYIEWPLSVARAYVEAFDKIAPGASLHAAVMDRQRVRARTGVTANIRSASTRSSVIIGRISGTTTLVWGATVKGESIGGNEVWFRVWHPGTSKVGFVHSSVVVRV